jgi:hypothetical protein
VELNNMLNYSYNAFLFLGSGNNVAKVAFDTGSHWLVVTSDLCNETCIT